MDTIFDAFFRALDICIPKDEKIMLLVEKRFHVFKPIDGGTQQLYNMLWDVDISPKADKCILPPRTKKRLGLQDKYEDDTRWGDTIDEFSPAMTMDDIWLSRKTLWLQDDLMYLGKRLILNDEFHKSEVLDLS